jgi:lysophospholipase L1-like esterase
MKRMSDILFWGSLLFLLPQAIYVRKTAPRFSPADGPTSGSAGTGKPLNLIAIGDSIVAGVGASRLTKALVGQTAEKLAKLLACQVNWQALGVNGIDSSGVIEQLIPRLPDKKANVYLVSVGVNDITGLSTLSRWERNLAEILKSLTRHSPDALIAVAGIPPLRGFPVLPQPLRALIGFRGEVFDRSARKLSSHHSNALHIPLDFEPTPDQFSADGFHPSEASYSEFGEMMASRIADRFKSASVEFSKTRPVSG